MLSDMKQQIRRAYDENVGFEQATETVCPCHPALGEAEERPIDRNGCGDCQYPYQQGMHVCGFGVHKGILAAVYAPLSRFDELYDVETAYRRGTMFSELDKPFYGDGKEVDCRGNEK